MFTRQLFITSAALLIIAASAFPQGEFLQGKESGLGGHVGRTMGDDVPYNFSYTIGYSARRVVDVAFTYAGLEDYDGSAYAVSMTFHLLDQKPQQPVNLAFTPSYDWISLDDN
ncbi:MAG: hypothetical protein JSW34_07340, partial [Candidatus Zixiibacteriota bacterium]